VSVSSAAVSASTFASAFLDSLRFCKSGLPVFMITSASPAIFVKGMPVFRAMPLNSSWNLVSSSSSQGLTLVHYSAQCEPFLTQKHTLITPTTP